MAGIKGLTQKVKICNTGDIPIAAPYKCSCFIDDQGGGDGAPFTRVSFFNIATCESTFCDLGADLTPYTPLGTPRPCEARPHIYTLTGVTVWAPSVLTRSMTIRVDTVGGAPGILTDFDGTTKTLQAGDLFTYSANDFPDTILLSVGSFSLTLAVGDTVVVNTVEA